MRSDGKVTFGARVLKTGVAVTLALYASMLLQSTPSVIAAVAAIFAMQPSIYRSWRYFREQLQTNTVGAVLALLAGKVFSNDPMIVGIICIIVIMICLKIKMEETVGITLVTVIAVMEASGQWHFALNRFLFSLIGIGSACLINVILIPPKPRIQFIAHIHGVFSTLSLLLRTAISDEIKENIFRDEKQGLESSLKSLADKYNLFEEESKKLRRAKYRQIRHVVVYKQMLNTLQKGLEVLDVIEQHFFQTVRTPELNQLFDRHIERLIHYHEHVLLKFDEKLKSETYEFSEMEEENGQFMQKFMNMYTESQEGMFRLSIVASVMYDYGYQIARLEKLVDQFLKNTEEQTAV